MLVISENIRLIKYVKNNGQWQVDFYSNTWVEDRKS